MFNIESLETRQLLSAAYNTLVPAAGTLVQGGGSVYTTITTNNGRLLVAGIQAHISKTGTLIVQGTGGNDTIEVTRTRPGGDLIVASGAKIQESVYVVTTSNTGAKIDYEFDIDTIKRIYIEGGAGNDDITIDSSVKRQATLIGGKGKDHLIGGPLGDVLSGGAGNDVLEAAQRTPITLTALPAKVPVQQQPGLGGRLFIPGTKKTSIVATNFVATGGVIQDHADSADLLEGGAGDDTLKSGAGPDTVNGGSGTDHLVAPDRGAAPKQLIQSGDKPIDFNGVTVISIEVIDPTALIFASGSPLASGMYQYTNGSGVTNTIQLSDTGKAATAVVELSGTSKVGTSVIQLSGTGKL